MGCLFYEEGYALADKQRYKSLVSAFDIVDVFAVSSLSPDMYEEYERIKASLINTYGGGVGNGPDEFLFI